MIVHIFIFLHLIRILESKDSEENTDSHPEQVVVRAVYINCEPNEEQSFFENEAVRFQREELFKHSALQGCHKKLALTVKISSEPNKSSGDEYIPIEHVFDGSNKRRARLLDPYILRLRRDTPLQAYKLRRIETVDGIISKSDDRRSSKNKKYRVQRNSDETNNFASGSRDREEISEKHLPSSPILDNTGGTLDIRVNLCGLVSDSNNLTDTEQLRYPKESTVSALEHDKKPGLNDMYTEQRTGYQQYEYTKVDSRVKRDACTLANNPAWKREKRHEHNIIVQDVADEYKIPWTVKDRIYRKLDYPTTKNREFKTSYEEKYTRNVDDIGTTESMSHHFLAASRHATSARGYSKEKHDNQLVSTKDTTRPYSEDLSTRKRLEKKSKITYFQNKNQETPEKSFVLYDIGNAELWYNVHVQLFEKMSNSEGKTVWNDITKGEIASVSTVHPEWSDQDLNVRYKPTEWMSKDEFELSSGATLCLLAPIHDEAAGDAGDEAAGLSTNRTKSCESTIGNYIVLPKADIINLDNDKSVLNKRDGNYSESSASETGDEQGHRRVLVRVSRALLTENEADLKISTLGSDLFLTLPHRRPHHAQIDLEARADENQLIRVGSSGSLITVVTDNSRRSRSVITVQATNKGLAAAKFRVRARDCGPEMAGIINERSEGLTAGPILVPPRHTQRFLLELPTEIPVDTIHCAVALINDDEESVAVRDVAIKKGDRCFCVWHCDCVCLNEDPKLSCREMAEARQAAAGLAPRGRARRARSVCYPDCVSVNLFVIIVGVLMALLIMGLAKACLGLFCRCVSCFGLERLVQAPRKLSRYYEPELQGRPVVYDADGWPVHPDTKQRTVRLISKPMEFMMNITIFITLPCLLLKDAIQELVCRAKTLRSDQPSPGGVDRKVFSTHDMQGRQPRARRRRGGLRDWMTPQAEQLSTDIWSKGLTAQKTVAYESMQPLLVERERRGRDARSSCADSEQDDTEYVLMQMQKSKESLARSQKKNNESGTPSTRKQLRAEAKVSHTITR